ncbi:hypothetical protein K435DRAFT_804000 [Dendrothele bispora CBS 962.96]|uniref:Uncharacterized protein n=1 Tax=Dendrothele bispora (strain CBS 962.96) TaxID=1314807 RepID=A0A4S8LG77_DENBC|nr:hypothetical protein K435DRAFT_804000 [Dendrothele bispora CBS 962.96]
MSYAVESSGKNLDGDSGLRRKMLIPKRLGTRLDTTGQEGSSLFKDDEEVNEERNNDDDDGEEKGLGWSSHAKTLEIELEEEEEVEWISVRQANWWNHRAVVLGVSWMQKIVKLFVSSPGNDTHTIKRLGAANSRSFKLGEYGVTLALGSRLSPQENDFSSLRGKPGFQAKKA